MNFLNKREWMRRMSAFVLVVFFFSMFTGSDLSLSTWAAGTAATIDAVKDMAEGDRTFNVILTNGQDLTGKTVTAPIYDETGVTLKGESALIQLETTATPNFAVFTLPGNLSLTPGRYMVKILADSVEVPFTNNGTNFLKVVPGLSISSRIQNTSGQIVKDAFVNLTESPNGGWIGTDDLEVKIWAGGLNTPNPPYIAWSGKSVDNKITVTETDIQFGLNGVQMDAFNDYTIEVIRTNDNALLGRGKMHFTGLVINDGSGNMYNSFPSATKFGLINTGRNDASIDVEGQSNAQSGTIPFMVRLNSMANRPGDYEVLANFLADSDYAQKTDAEKLTAIPVKPNEVNTIVLNYKDANGNVISTSYLTWKPQNTQFVFNNTPDGKYKGINTFADLGLVNTNMQDAKLMITGSSTDKAGFNMNFAVAANAVIGQPGNYNINAKFVDDATYAGANQADKEKLIPVKPDANNEIHLEFRDANGTFLCNITFQWFPDGGMPFGPKFSARNAVYQTFIGMTVQPEIMLYGAPNTTAAVEVTGGSNVPQQPELPIILQLNSIPQKPGDYSVTAHFVTEADYQAMDAQQKINAIPVRPNMDNDIHLELKDANGKVIAGMSFKWKPARPGEESIWSNAILQPEWQFPVVGKNPEIYAEIADFQGADSNLSAELVYYDQATNTFVNKCALNNAVMVSQDANRKVYKFTWVQGDLNDLVNAPDGLRLQANVMYDDPVEPSIHLRRTVGEVNVDVREPQPYAKYEGTFNGQYKIHVGFNDDIDLSYLQANKDALFTLTADDGTVLTLLSVAGCRQNGEQDWPPFRAVDLFFTPPTGGSTLTVKDVSDLAGNVMSMPFSLLIKPAVHITGVVKEQVGGAVLPNAEVRMVKIDGLPSGGNNIWMEGFNTDDKGMFDRWIAPGTYKITEINIYSPNGGRRISTDQDVVINGDFNFDVFVMPANVSGKVAGDVNEVHPDTLVFMNTQYLQAPWDTMDPFMLEKTFRRDITTEDNGNFSIYLKPGTYKLLGKEVGYSIVSPVNEVTFTVPEGGNYTISGDITFPPMNVTGIVKDNSGYLIGNAAVEIFPQAPGNKPFTACTDLYGKFGAVLTDGSYKIEQIVIEKNESLNGGIYHMDVLFDVVNGQVTNVTGQNQEQGTLDGIKLPAPNVHLSILENGLPLSTQDKFTFIDFNGDQYGRGLDSQTGQYDFYLRPGNYSITRASTKYMELNGINEAFTVNPGDTNITRSIDIAQQSNVIIKVTDDKGMSVQNVGVSIEGIDNGRREWRPTNRNGEVFFSFEPGRYKISGYDLNGTWTQVNQEFSVTAENDNINRCMVDLTIQTPNVTGVALDEGGLPIQWGGVKARRLPDTAGNPEEYSEFKTDENGRFTAFLKAGTYVVDGVGTEGQWYEMKLTFTVIIEGGVTTIQMPDGTVTTGELRLQKQPDTTPPDPWARFEGTFNGQYKIHVGFNDDIDLSYLQANKEALFILTANDGTVFTPLSVIGCMENGGGQDGQYFRAVDLLFTPPQGDSTLVVRDVPDVKGNTMSTPFNFGIKPPVHITGVVKEQVGGAVLPKAKVQMVKMDGLPNSNDNNIQTEWLFTNDKGMFDFWVVPGNYKVTQISVYSPNGERQIAADQDVVINGDSNFDIFVMPANVFGKAVKDVNATQPDKLVFMDTKYLQDPAWKAMDPYMLERTFRKDVIADDNGNFGLYLKPGTYKLLGKEIGYNVISPINDVTFTVPESGNYTIPNDIVFPPMNAVGIVKDNAGNLVADATVEISPMQPGQPFTIFTDMNGKFGTVLADGSYRIEQVVLGRNKGINGGIYHMDVLFDVVQGQITNVRGQHQEQGTLNNIKLPAPNVHLSIVENGTPLSTESNGTYIDFEGDNYGRGLESQTGQYDFYLRPGNYNVTKVDTIYRDNSYFPELDGINEAFTVNIGDTGIERTIDIARQANAMIKVMDDKGMEVQNADVFIDRADNSWNRWHPTNARGEAYFNLEPGMYKISGYSIDGIWHGADQAFEVTAENTPGNRCIVNLMVQTPNVNGIALDESGQPIQWGGVKARRLADIPGDPDEFFEFKTNESGRFVTFLKPGTYIVDGVGTQAQWYEMKLQFTVTIENGVTTIQMSDGSIVTGDLTLQKQPDTTPPQPWARFEGNFNGQYRIHVGFNDDINLSNLQANKDAYFTLTADDGTSLTLLSVEGCMENGGGQNGQPFRAVDLFFTPPQAGSTLTVNGVSDLKGNVMTVPFTFAIQPAVHITGVVKEQASGMVLANAEVQMVKMGGQPNPNDNNIRMEWLNTNDQGMFDRWVDPGNYKIVRINVNSPDGQRRIAANQDVVINGDMSFDIFAMSANVFGKVVRDVNDIHQDTLVFMDTQYLQAPWNAMDPYRVKDAFRQDVITDDNGNFGIYLKPGTYRLLGKEVGYSIVKPVTDVIFTVPEGGNYTISGDLVFPQSNVRGILKDNAGNPVADASVEIQNMTPDKQPFTAYTDIDGKFCAVLADGSYKIVQVVIENNNTMNGGLYQMDVLFDVVNGQVTNVTQNQAPATLSSIQLPAPNVHLSIVENGTPLPTRDSFTFIDFRADWYGRGLQSRTGQFDFYLSPGNYSITKVDTKNMHLESINEAITVNAGDTNISRVIDITQQSNVMIKVKDDKKMPVQNVGVSIDGIENGRHEWRQTNAQGEVFFSLEPGSYKVSGYDINGNWTEVNQAFDVAAENDNINRCVVDLTVQAPNITGLAMDESGQAIQWGWISARRLPDTVGNYEEYFNFKADESGKFAAFLKPGTYIVDGVGAPEKWFEMQLKFIVTIESGITKIQMPDGSITEGVLKLQKQPDNVSGFLYKGKDANGQPILYKGRMGEPNYDPSTMPLDVNLLLRQAGISNEQYMEAPWLYEKWVSVKADGSFHTNLELGKTYYPKAVVDAGRYIEINMIDMLIQVPKKDFTIIPPAPNFSGVVKDYDGNPIGRAWVNLQSQDGTEWIGMDTDENGSFGRNLKAGTTYIIRDVNQHTETRQPDGTISYSDTRYVFNKSVTITDTMTSVVLMPNIKGTITMPDLMVNTGTQGQNTNYFAGISIRPVFSADDPRYSDMKENPWKYESWIPISVDQAGIGSFMGYLQAGNYTIAGISSPNGWVEINKTFSIDKSNNSIVTYDIVKDRYALNIDYQPNITGEIKDINGQPVAYAWVSINKGTPGPDPNYWTMETFFGGVGASKDGTFKLKLEDGEYRISGYSTPGTWNNNVWEPGKWVEVGLQFKVVNGQLKDWDGNPQSTILIQPNVSGLVKKLYKAGDEGQPDNEGYVQLKEAWIALRPANDTNDQNRTWAHTGNDGEFSLMLKPGQYVVVEAGGANFWTKTNIPFTIDNTKHIISDGKFVVNGKLVVKPNLVGMAYKDKAKTQPVKWGGIVIKPLNAKDEDWSQSIWVGTKEDGSFENFVGQGEWKIVGMSTESYWQRLYIPFTVDAQGKMTSPISGLIGADGTMTLTPPDANVVGSIKDKDNHEIQKEAWLNIKREGTDVSAWNQYYGIQYKQQANGKYRFADNLEPGVYIITSVGGMDFWFECNIKFTIDEVGKLIELTPGTVQEDGTLIVAPPAPNVTGTAYGTINGATQTLSKGWLSFARFDATGKQITMDGLPITDSYTPAAGDLYWNYTKWAEIDENGNFQIALKPGSYKVVSVGAQNVWYQPDQSFTVAEGQPVTLEVNEPAPNVTIIVKNTGSDANEGWIDVSTKKDGMRYYLPVKLSHKNGSDFVFKARLKAGEYDVANFGSSNAYLPLEYKFTLETEANTVITIDCNVQTTKTVKGTLIDGGNPIDGKAWVAIMPVINGQIDMNAEKKWVQTDADQVGAFLFKLDANTTWAIVEISTSSGYYQINNPLAYTYTVNDTTEQSAWNIDLATINN